MSNLSDIKGAKFVQLSQPSNDLSRTFSAVGISRLDVGNSLFPVRGWQQHQVIEILIAHGESLQAEYSHCPGLRKFISLRVDELFCFRATDLKKDDARILFKSIEWEWLDPKTASDQGDGSLETFSGCGRRKIRALNIPRRRFPIVWNGGSKLFLLGFARFLRSGRFCRL
ncbi:MAG: hypothetical protein R3C10_01510 [Pirellulales bacterium]